MMVADFPATRDNIRHWFKIKTGPQLIADDDPSPTEKEMQNEVIPIRYNVNIFCCAKCAYMSITLTMLAALELLHLVNNISTYSELPKESTYYILLPK